MSITVRVQGWISGNHSNSPLKLKPCSFLTKVSIAHVSTSGLPLPVMSLGLHYMEGKIHLHPLSTQPLALDGHFQLRAHFHPITTHQRFPFPSFWLRETQAIKSLQCFLSARCNLKPISDMTHNEHEEISPRRSKCQFLSESNITNEKVIRIIFLALIESLRTDFITSHY